MNKFLIRGKLFRDWKVFMVPNKRPGGPEMMPLAVNTILARSNIAVGQKSSELLYMDISLFGDDAEKAMELTKKDDQVQAQGYLRQRKYVDPKTGQTKYKINMIAKIFTKLDPSKEWDIEGRDKQSVPWD